jgi:hypothetical protein
MSKHYAAKNRITIIPLRCVAENTVSATIYLVLKDTGANRSNTNNTCTRPVIRDLDDVVQILELGQSELSE